MPGSALLKMCLALLTLPVGGQERLFYVCSFIINGGGKMVMLFLCSLNIGPDPDTFSSSKTEILVLTFFGCLRLNTALARSMYEKTMLVVRRNPNET